jgi:hypothetical protein
MTTFTLPAPYHGTKLSAFIRTRCERRVVERDGKFAREWVTVGTLVFTGASTGTASVELFTARRDSGERLTFDAERALEHWAGYVENAGSRLYRTGDCFTAPLRWRQTFRVERVLKQGLRARGRVAYQGRNGGTAWGALRYFDTPTIIATERNAW